jgi:hypothetical protein
VVTALFRRADPVTWSHVAAAAAAAAAPAAAAALLSATEAVVALILTVATTSTATAAVTTATAAATAEATATVAWHTSLHLGCSVFALTIVILGNICHLDTDLKRITILDGG